MLTQSYYKRRSPDFLTDGIIGSTVQEVLALARRHLLGEASRLKVLDVGSGSGEYSFELEKYVGKVVGVEPYSLVYKEAIAAKRKNGSSAVFINEKIEDVQIKQRFDLVISLTTLEHMPDAFRSFQKIFELMKKGGLLYVTAPNKFWPLEQHYHLPFLSWLPLKWANIYMRLTRKGSSYEDCSYSFSYRGMKRFFDRFPCEYKFILPENANVGYLGCGEGGVLYKFVLNLGIRLIRFHPFFWNFSKGFAVVAIKK